MRLDGFGLFVDDMAKMIRFYKDVLGFEIKEEENTSNVYLVKDGTLFLLYGRNDFEKMTNRRYEYINGLNGHFEMALYVDTFEEVDGKEWYRNRTFSIKRNYRKTRRHDYGNLRQKEKRKHVCDELP